MTLRRTEAISTKPTLGSSERSITCDDSPLFTSVQLKSMVLPDMGVALSDPGALSAEPGLDGLAFAVVSTQTANAPALQALTNSLLQLFRTPPAVTHASTSSAHASRHQRPSDAACAMGTFAMPTTRTTAAS